MAKRGANPRSARGKKGADAQTATDAASASAVAMTPEQRTQFLLATTSGPSLSGRTRAALGAFGHGFVAWIKSSAERVIVYAVIGFAVGWVFNVVVMAVGYDGYGKVPKGGPATGAGNGVGGSVFCFGATAIIAGLVAHRRRVGGEQFWSDVRGFPGTVTALTRQDASGAGVHALWGFAGFMLVISLIGPWLVGIVAVGFLVGVVGYFRPLVTGVLMITWQWVGSKVRPQGVPAPAPPLMVVAGLGGLAAVAVGLVLPDQASRALVGIAAGVAAFVLGRRQVSAPAAAALVLAVVAVALALRYLPALAADGGYFECDGNLLNCPGLDQDGIHAIPGAVATGAGAVAGGATGHHRRRRTPPGGTGHCPCEDKGAIEAASDWQLYQATHPGPDGTLPAVGSESWREFMAHRTEFDRQAAEAKLKKEFDDPLNKIKGDLQGIDDKLKATTTDIHQAQVAVKILEETANLDVNAWARVGRNLQDDISSGEAFKRAALTGLKLPSTMVIGTGEAFVGLAKLPEMSAYAAGWWYDNYHDPYFVTECEAQFGTAMVQQFSASMDKLSGGSRDQASGVIADIAGSVGGGEIMGFCLSKILAAGKTAIVGDALPKSAGDIPAGGIPLDTAEKRAAVGHSEAVANQNQAAVDELGIRNQMERGSPDAISHEGSAYSKSEGMKDLKSLHEYNGSVGGPGREASSLMGLFEPKPPPFWASQAVKDAFAEAKGVYDRIPGKDEAAKRAYIESKPVTVYVDGVKKSFYPKFDENGIMRDPENGWATKTDHDGWDSLSGDGKRSLGHNADGSKASAAVQSADRALAVELIRRMQQGFAQWQHSNRTRLWKPNPQLKWGGEQLPYFDCKLPNIAARKEAKVAAEGVVEYRPGSVDADGNSIPWLTQAHGTTPPPPTAPGLSDGASEAAGVAGAAVDATSSDDSTGPTTDGAGDGSTDDPGASSEGER